MKGRPCWSPLSKYLPPFCFVSACGGGGGVRRGAQDGLGYMLWPQQAAPLPPPQSQQDGDLPDKVLQTHRRGPREVSPPANL